MNKIRLAIFFGLIGHVYLAYPCSLATSGLFTPAIDNYVSHKTSDLEAEVPRIIVKSVSVHRGTDDAGTSCDDAGTIAIEVVLSDESPFNISELGFEFSVAEGSQPAKIFDPSYALSAFPGDSDKTGTIYLAWLDGHPRRQTSLELLVRINAISNDGRRGATTRFPIKADKGTAKGFFSRIFGS